MESLKVALLGFGTVGEGVYRTIGTHQERLQKILGKRVEVVAVLIRDARKRRNIEGDVLITADFNDILSLPQLDVVIEAIVEKEPSYTYLKKAIKKGAHIITANKEMFAHHGKELIELAEKYKVSVGFEATVAGGVPIIQTLRQLLMVNSVQKIEGILNGTSNFILSEMREKKQAFAGALFQAQENGYAEADPSNDVEGTDAFYKLMILSKLAFGKQPDWNKVEIAGITSITGELVVEAQKLGLRFKHIASVQNVNGRIIASVKPALVARSHPFYHIEGVQNAVNIQADIVGGITLSGPGAGMYPTASALIEDLVQINKDAAVSFSNASDILEGRENKKERAYWLIARLEKKMIIPALEWVEQLSNGSSIVKCDKKVIKKLSDQNPALIFYPIMGEIELEKDHQSRYVSSWL